MHQQCDCRGTEEDNGRNASPNRLAVNLSQGGVGTAAGSGGEESKEEENWQDKHGWTS